MGRKIVLGFVFILSASMSLYGVFGGYFLSPEERFYQLWNKDFQLLQAKKILHKGFENISKVEITATTDFLKRVIEKGKVPGFKNSQEGLLLQIFLDQTDEGSVVVLYDLIDQKGNTVWELGRTFSAIQ